MTSSTAQAAAVKEGSNDKHESEIIKVLKEVLSIQFGSFKDRPARDISARWRDMSTSSTGQSLVSLASLNLQTTGNAKLVTTPASSPPLFVPRNDHALTSSLIASVSGNVQDNNDWCTPGIPILVVSRMYQRSKSCLFLISTLPWRLYPSERGDIPRIRQPANLTIRLLAAFLGFL